MGERAVGVCGAAERHEQRRREFGQHLAGAGAGDGGAAAEMPAAHGLGGGLLVAEAELAQGRQRVGIELRPGEAERAGLARERRPFLEQQGVMALDAFRMRSQRLTEGCGGSKTAKARKGFEIGLVGRKRLGLLVMTHLQAVFDGAQEAVGLRQFVAGCRRDPALLCQRAEHLQRAWSAQPLTPAAEDELLRLHEELDLADAAAPKFHIVPGDRDRLMALHRLDLALHRMDVGDRGEIEIFAPDEGRKIGDETLAQCDVAGDGTGLDHRGPLPVLADGFVIGIGARQGDGDMGRGGVGPQAQIDAEDIAVGRALLDDAGDLLGELDVEARGFGYAGGFGRLGIEEDDDVDVGGVVQLARTMLAQRQHDEARALAGLLRIRQRDPSKVGGLAQDVMGSEQDRRIRGGGERTCHRLDVPDPADIGERDQQRHRLAEAA